MRAHLISLVKDTSQVYLAQLIGLVVSFGISIIVARHLGAEGRGAYGWIMALNTIAIQVGLMGTDTLNRRFGARHKNKAPALAANSFLQAVTLGIVVALAFYIYGLTQTMGQLYPLALLLGLLAVPSAILMATWNALGTGLGHASILARAEIIQRLVTAATISLFLLTITLQVWHLAIGVIAGFLAGGASSGRHLKHLMPGTWKPQLSLFKHEKRLLVTAFGAGLCLQLLQRIDILLLAAFRPLAETGYYAIAQTLTDAMFMFPGAIGYMLLPRLAEQTIHKQRLTMFLWVLGGTMVLSAILALAASLLAPWFIPLLFGEDFTTATPVFQRLALAGIIFVGYTICQSAVAGTARARHIIIAPLVGVLLKASIGWLIIPHGMLAAANASILAYGGAFVVAFYLACMAKTK